MQTFTPAQIATLRAQFAAIGVASPAMLPRFRALFDGCTDEMLVQLARAEIKFVSKLAINACVRRGVKLS